jgi:hypothetical protein
MAIAMFSEMENIQRSLWRAFLKLDTKWQASGKI